MVVKSGSFTRSYVVDKDGNRLRIEREKGSIHVRDGSLDLRDCTNVMHLPDNLIVHGSLYLQGCTGLAKLPPGLYVEQDLLIDYCTGLAHLPENLFCGGNLSMIRCPNLQRLPAAWIVNGNLFIHSGTELAEIGEGLMVGGNMIISTPRLRTLPENFSVKGNLDLLGCGALMIPPDLATKVEGNIILPGGGKIRQADTADATPGDSLLEQAVSLLQNLWNPKQQDR